MKLIHVAHFQPVKGKKTYLFLREISKENYQWFEFLDPEEKKTDIVGRTIPDAISNARKKWKHEYFKTLNCGFRYTLPERDEHGINALFHQMAASYASSNGIYFDEDVGNNCFINFASQEAKNLLALIKSKNQL